jgi:hypothetical protein
MVTEDQAARLASDLRTGLYFDWSPETAQFSSHIDNARVREERAPVEPQ